MHMDDPVNIYECFQDLGFNLDFGLERFVGVNSF